MEISYQSIFIAILVLIILGLFAHINHTKTEFENTKTEFENTKTEFENTKTELENTKKELENTKKEFENTKTELENTKKELENTKKELEKTTSFCYFIYLSFAQVSAALGNQYFIRNTTKNSVPPIIVEIYQFLHKYANEKFGGRGEFVKIESEFKTKLERLTAINIKSIDLAY